MKTYEESTEEIIKEVNTFFGQLRGKYDFRLVAAAALNEASYTMQCALSVKQTTEKQVAEFFAASLNNAIEPLEKPAVLVINDGGDSGRLQ